MAKLTWNTFVTKYPGAGHIVLSGTQPKNFAKPTGISKKNSKQFPSVPNLVKEALAPMIKGDWAHRSESVPGFTTKNGKRVPVRPATLHHFIFADATDASTAAKFLKAPATSKPHAGFSSITNGSEIDTREYVRIAMTLGY